MELKDKIFIAGHQGMVGSAIHRHLSETGYTNFILRTSKELDLRNQEATKDFFEENKPEYVFLAAAKVGGILANKEQKATFIYDNLMIQSNVMHHAYLAGVRKLLFLGSSCIYPKLATQPLRENALLSGPLEPTNDAYAIAKIAGIKMVEAYRDQFGTDFISAMPTNLYGYHDNYDLQNAHVLPALIRKFHIAKKENTDSVIVWGTGTPRREFLHADDLADACVWLMLNYTESETINVGTGEDISIAELAQLIQKIVGYSGKIQLDASKPDGTPRKLLDISKLKERGWVHKIELEEGIRKVYTSLKNEDWY